MQQKKPNFIDNKKDATDSKVEKDVPRSQAKSSTEGLFIENIHSGASLIKDMLNQNENKFTFTKEQ